MSYIAFRKRKASNTSSFRLARVAAYGDPQKLFMDYEKKRLTPVVDAPSDDDDPAKKQAREQLKQARRETERYKQKYFELYDDVKISHREDW